MGIPLNMPKKRLSSKIPSLLVLILIGPFLQMALSLQTSYNSKFGKITISPICAFIGAANSSGQFFLRIIKVPTADGLHFIGLVLKVNSVGFFFEQILSISASWN